MAIAVKVEELKKAIEFLGRESREFSVNVSIDGHKLLLRSFDKSDREIEIELYDKSVEILPKVKKTDFLG